MPSFREISTGVIGALIGTAIIAVGSVALSLLDASIPVWVLLPVGGATGLAGFVAGQVARGMRTRDLPSYHADHVAEIILTLQAILAGKHLSVSFDDFIERGILAPARFGLIDLPDEDVRLSVLVPDNHGHDFRMMFEAGHGVGRKADFSIPVAGSFAGFAFKSGQLEWTSDVERDDRWKRRPRARRGREYGSLVAMPVLVGDDTVAVLGVLSTERGGFFKGDLAYIEMLGTLIGLCWTLPGGPAGPSSTLLPPTKES